VAFVESPKHLSSLIIHVFIEDR